MRERLDPRIDSLGLLLSTVVPGVGHDGNHPSGPKERCTDVQGAPRRVWTCGDRLIASGQVAQIEHHGPHPALRGLGHLLSHGLVAGLDEPDRSQRGLVGPETPPGLGEGFLLHVEPDHGPRRPNRPREKKRVVPVAHRRVDGESPVLDRLPGQIMCKVQDCGQGHGRQCKVLQVKQNTKSEVRSAGSSPTLKLRKFYPRTESRTAAVRGLQAILGLTLSPTMAVFVDLGDRSYTVHFQSLADVPTLMADAGLSPGRCLLVSDQNVAAHYKTPLVEGLSTAGWTVRSIVRPPGEQTKSASHLHSIYDEALAWGIDRQTPVLALGGGVIGDLAGFAAATLLRGLPLVQLPTSLLAQVDASVGGKTAINHDTGKNLIGAFYQPTLVCADPYTLDTLPMREYTSGMAEVIKHALIRDPGLFEILGDNLVPVMARKDRDAISSVIENAVRVKAEVVSEDEREEGRRAILNFGHTFAHALERVAGYGAFTHGEAVALGMRAGLYLSHKRHPDALSRDRIDHIINAVPVEEDPSEVPFSELYEAMSADKKNQGGTIRFVLLERLGKAYVTGDVTESDVRQAWCFACSG